MEIERKFLVLNDDFKAKATAVHSIIQAYLVADERCTVRIRLCNDEAYLTIKGKTNEGGLSRSEYEYPVPFEEAKEMLTLCLPGYIMKQRYCVPHKGHVWEVDVFEGRHKGLVIAEVELATEDESIELPDWIGNEVTGNRRYYNSFIAGIQK
ncbi:CYTH domain-containing protein [Porphyromonas gingivalis]|uniref:Adenylate cyclase n=1 Tax=Porphyromonas gingivalis F0570 TaxID=1227271 RepID=A0A0E2LTB1_PORGN|nr:CYTH domain-containing protein [Porphyromonas gingivalis]ERJ68965.1 adenylate cyclase [Porphyromonas gingivalis F0570]